MSTPPIFKLPDELLDAIFDSSSIALRDQWALIRTSQRLRRVLLLPYLRHFGITQASIDSGTLRIFDSFRVIVIVGNMRPIKRLICFDRTAEPGVERTGATVRQLGTVLKSVPPIPDVLIYNGPTQVRTDAVPLLLEMPALSPTSTVLIITPDSEWILSRPRLRPIHGVFLPPPHGRYWKDTLGPTFWPTVGKLLLVVIWITSFTVSGLIPAMLLYNAVVPPLIWMRKTLRGRWPLADRLRYDLKTRPAAIAMLRQSKPLPRHRMKDRDLHLSMLFFTGWMRIQYLAVPNGRPLVLATIVNSNPVDDSDSELTIRRPERLQAAQFDAVFRALDFGARINHLVVSPGVGVAYEQLFDLLGRHPAVESVTLDRKSMRTPLSASASGDDRVICPTIQRIQTPMAYLPSLLPISPNVQKISVRDCGVPAATHVAALEAISGLAGTHPICLVFVLRSSTLSGSFPWNKMQYRQPHDEESQLQIEPRLVRVEEITVNSVSDSERSQSRGEQGNNAFARWLGLFPNLNKLVIASRFVSTAKGVDEKKRAELVKEILERCRGLDESSIIWMAGGRSPQP
ncbi:hypothetical protein HMN09_00465100 [Mycena chlorophos]|uniref:Uncharacterized protein n=1 Tax=Mycena chlorophos TaxID=658473 RepID=A0A8H6WHS2_MYCCL|nr:hypothetical protein HMN09_00465100 [Mycena chlorophos]